MWNSHLRLLGHAGTMCTVLCVVVLDHGGILPFAFHDTLVQVFVTVHFQEYVCSVCCVFLKMEFITKVSKDLRYEIILLKVNDKLKKNYVKVGVGIRKTKTFFVLFLNALSILELMLCNQNLTKLVYQNL